jgi:starch phosphorylase
MPREASQSVLRMAMGRAGAARVRTARTAVAWCRSPSGARRQSAWRASAARPISSGPVPLEPETIRIAYYSMEVALDDDVPTFSGGLGVLAGDYLRAAADRGTPIAGVTLLYSHGFFRQSIRGAEQREEPVDWSPPAELEDLGTQAALDIAGVPVALRVWRARLVGVDGHEVPVYLLDTDVGANRPEDRAITDRLYVSDPGVRLRQEAVLGLGGPLVLEALGHHAVRVHHMNEGHGSLVPVALLSRRAAKGGPAPRPPTLAGAGARDVDAVRASCVFTTHTPVAAGHDRFDRGTAEAVLGRGLVASLGALGCLEEDGSLNMTVLGMRLSGTVNAVSLRHRDVTRAMFPGQPVEAITNGVHSVTWAAPATAAVFDRHLPGWRRDSQQLRYATGVPLGDLGDAHRENKVALLAEVRRRCGVALRPDVLTIGVARRFAVYKRNDLVLDDPERLASLAKLGPLQIVFAGKAHPGDAEAKAMVARVAAVASAGAAAAGVSVVFVENYGMALGRLLCSGSDVWLNNPAPPNEASGTSGMKAALNGVPSLSTLDGWWLEGWVEGVTGWAIRDARHDGGSRAHAAERLYSALEQTVLPAYYEDPAALVAVGRHAIALNGSFFSAHRMADEYLRRAYREPLAG